MGLSLLAELKRRNVFKVGAAYLVVGWVIIEVASTIAPQLNLPEWAPRFITFVILLGFPIALVLAWIFDMTPEGVQVTEGRGGNWKFYTMVGVIIAASLGWFFFDRQDTVDLIVVDAAQVSPSIAVLPFIDLSQGKDQGYFADGIAEEILNLLARNPELRVVARTSAFQFRDAADLREVGAALSANRILEGSVRTSGNRIRITAQLIDTHSGLHLWSETYDRELTDIFVLQDEIATAITVALGSHLGAPAMTPRAAPVDADAYDLYLRGRKGLSDRAIPGRLAEAIELLEQAVTRDPALAVAHGTLALAQVVSPWYMDIAPSESLARTMLSADRALALEPDNVEALVAKGYGLAFIGLRVAEGERLLQRALELRPNDYMANNLMGDVARMLGDRESTLRYETRAADLDPLDSVAHTDLAFAHLMDGNFDQALVHARRATSLEPRNRFAASATIRSLLLMGDLTEARAKYQQALADGIFASDRMVADMEGLVLAVVAGDEPGIAQSLQAMEAHGVGMRAVAAYLAGDIAGAGDLLKEALAGREVSWVSYGEAGWLHLAISRAGQTIPAPPVYHDFFQRYAASPWADWDMRAALIELRDRQVAQ